MNENQNSDYIEQGISDISFPVHENFVGKWESLGIVDAIALKCSSCLFGFEVHI